MTYGEKIDQMISTIQKLYDDADWMRDYADLSEKEHWNIFRGNFFIADKPLQKLIDKVRTHDRYDMPLHKNAK